MALLTVHRVAVADRAATKVTGSNTKPNSKAPAEDRRRFLIHLLILATS